MPLYDARCSGCAVLHEDLIVAQGEGLPDCPLCGAHLVRRPVVAAVHIAQDSQGAGRTMRWADVSPSDLDTASRATRTHYEMCRSHGIGRDRAREISAVAGPQTQTSAEDSRKAIEASQAGSGT